MKDLEVDDPPTSYFHKEVDEPRVKKKPSITHSDSINLVANQLPIDSHSMDNQYPISSQLDADQVQLDSHLNANQLSIDSRSIADQMSIDSQAVYHKEKEMSSLSMVNELSINSQSIANQLPISSKLIVDHMPIDTQLISNQYPLNSHIKDNYVTDENAISFLNRIGNLKLKEALSTAQFNVLIFIFRNIDVSNFETNIITKKGMANNCNISELSVQSTIQKLIKLGFITRSFGKSGKGGFFKLKINKQIYQKLINDLKIINSQSVVDQYPISAQLISNEQSIAPSKLVSNINTNLLTNPPPTNTSENLNDDMIDVSAISIEKLLPFHITRKQIQDIKNQKLNFTTSSLQDFVDRFAIYVSDPRNIKGVNSIPAIFVKMAQLCSKGEDPLSDIETDTDRFIRERLERLKRKREERLKQEMELLEMEFEEWFDCLSSEQIEKIAPASPIMKTGSPTQKIILKNYFIENLWPEKKQTLFSRPETNQILNN
jgi:hypothetical protein